MERTSKSEVTRHDRLAVVGGFVKPPPSAPHGTEHAGFAICEGLADSGRYREVHIFRDPPDEKQGGLFVPPGNVPASCQRRGALATANGVYSVVYVANGEQMRCPPHLVRPSRDWVPVVCEIGTVHHPAQWSNLLIGAHSQALRPTDGFMFKSRRAERIFGEVWGDWRERFGVGPQPRSVVLPNGIDPAKFQRREALRQMARRELGLTEQDVMFLAFSRLSPGTKGDQRAMVALWRRVVEKSPNAFLVLAGAIVDRGFVDDLRTTARMVGVGNRVAVIENPFEARPDAGARLFAAADVFLHATTGVEEVSPFVVLEAMAHELPIIASDWAGLPELVREGRNGWILPTISAPVLPGFSSIAFAENPTVYAARLGRFSACDAGALVERAVGLAHNRQLRLDMGGHSRRLVETELSLQEAVSGRMRFFDELSKMAQAAADTAPPRGLVPLVNLGRVLALQATGTLAQDQCLRLVDAGGAQLLPADASDLPQPIYQAALQHLLQVRECRVRDLVSVVSELLTGLGPELTPELRENVAMLAVIRLLSYGVVAHDDRATAGKCAVG
jgi:glycosyltransferase involved in cell wall biosynthesis